MLTFRATLTVCVLSMLCAMPSSHRRAHADAPASPLGRWCGTFAYAGDDDERRAIRQAVTQATSSMGPLVRRFARSRLSSKTRPDPELKIEVDGRSIGIGAGAIWTTPIDGSTRTVRDSDGSTYEVSQRLVDGQIEQQILTDDLTLHNVYVLSPDASALEIHVSFTHTRLPAPVSYQLTYRRAH